MKERERQVNKLARAISSEILARIGKERFSEDSNPVRGNNRQLMSFSMASDIARSVFKNVMGEEFSEGRHHHHAIIGLANQYALVNDFYIKELLSDEANDFCIVNGEDIVCGPYHSASEAMMDLSGNEKVVLRASEFEHRHALVESRDGKYYATSPLGEVLISDKGNILSKPAVAKTLQVGVFIPESREVSWSDEETSLKLRLDKKSYPLIAEIDQGVVNSISYVLSGEILEAASRDDNLLVGSKFHFGYVSMSPVELVEKLEQNAQQFKVNDRFALNLQKISPDQEGLIYDTSPPKHLKVAMGFNL